MDKKDFERWYRDNIEIMASLGVLHPESTSGKTVYLAVASLQPQLNDIITRLESIEEKLDIDYQPVVQINKVKQKPSEWQVGKKR